mmetsp:Transcript_10747/g.22527  ORF Transcript_10747/g.22527 Transcript_10747/m.22527 type:complete len:402 (-) Transcript_10747:77-1282(-)|eukprot:CAMPEP_0183294542 /NCGR_PEP_ID=MMETSP0160_2-20130417/2842_1 /TAXON_ID=2839 ORGANISM="Odontella Sinensis, Strain Grunow 1884" /NCGR_SAMPLE_ID=MMETSP0160_2 /ASSEMBLY_ACC=CAM_ASM_000250 /LENGTH=401 /DNA_ID=CAMNT_0025455887 /DNA_START=89 /DNA_END=1294 /DNA_ORIENTATION=+
MDEGDVAFDVMPPVVDMSLPESELVAIIASACSSWGFFQLVNHGIDPSDVAAFRRAMERFFGMPRPVKLGLKRDERNARGYFDDELTKRRRDWKEGWDVGVPGSRDWDDAVVPDDGEGNDCLDGHNRFPTEMECPKFREAVVRYFGLCEVLADRIAILMGRGLGAEPDAELLEDLRQRHTSYLRMNYYPVYDPSASPRLEGEDLNGVGSGDPDPPLGISPHRDAGFLTVLLQDEDCHSLQVARFPNGDESLPPSWVTVRPVLGSLTANTGDMAMIWSDGKYHAPLHRVLTNKDRVRYSAPFFYNPGYGAKVSPLPNLPWSRSEPMYDPCSWGYFRAVRFAGDLTDLGVEIQTSDFERQREAKEGELDNLKRQELFLKEANFTERFSVEKYRPLLQVSISGK